MDENAASRQALADKIRREHLHGKSKRGFTLKLFVIVIAACAAAALLWLQWQQRNSDEEIATPRNATEQYGFVVSGGENADAPVEVVIYEDFLCESCRVFHEDSAELLSSQVESGAISLEYRPFAFLTDASSNEYSQRAVNAAICVADSAGVESFVTMHDLLFEHQPAEGGPGPDDADLVAFAETAGASDVSDCITGRTFEAWAAQALDAAIAADVTSTPTVRVDGVTILRSTNGQESMPGPEELLYAIERSTS